MTIHRALIPGDPDWLADAFLEIGVREIAPDDSPRIVEYHQHTSLGATNDETPWCSSYCCYVIDNAGFTSTNSAAAQSWLRWGRVIDTPERGCIVIFERLDEDGNIIPHRGHCGFWLGEDETNVWVLGGNQKNRVSVDTYPRARVLGYRWPAKAINSTTNIASVTAGLGTIATAAPAAINALNAVEGSTDKVLTMAERVSGLLERLMAAPDSLLSVAGLAITIAALWHIVRERNKKIKRLGV